MRGRSLPYCSASDKLPVDTARSRGLSENIVRTAAIAKLALLPGTGPVFAQGAPDPKPTDDSIQQLLAIMQARKILETVSAQMDKMFSATVNKHLEGKTLTPDQQQSIEDNRARAAALMKEMLSRG
jgi:hypothetical protein